MNNDRLYGIVFRKGHDCGIANITVLNTTTNKYVDAVGATYDTLVYRTIDLYEVGTAGPSKDFTYWISLTPNDNYSITVEHSGAHNVSAVSPYNINIVKYLEVNQLTDGYVSKVLRVWHNDSPTDYTDYIVPENQTIPLDNTITFNGNGSNKLFSINGTNHASIPVKFSNNAGDSWYTPSDPVLSWGSNDPDYNNNQVDSNGYFTLKWDDSPQNGVGNVVIVYKPKINRWKFTAILHQPKSTDLSYIDVKSNINQLDFSLELTK